MSIVVGTDFSEASARALAAAAQLAVRNAQPLHVLHAVELGEPEQVGASHEGHIATLRTRLEQAAEPLRKLGATVSVHVEQGSPDDALLALGAQLRARLIVVAALGTRRSSKALLGSRADRLAQHAQLPVLVVRSAEAFEAWARGSRPLRVLLGADLSLSSRHAMAWFEQLRSLGPCELVAAHLYWPPTEFLRLGLTGVRSYTQPDPEVTAALRRELGHHLPALQAEGTQLRLEPHLGRLGDRLASLGAEERADLIVVGSHNHTLRQRLWHGSVSHVVLEHATTNVACIPAPADAALPPARPFRNVVVATDFSDIGNSAITLAYRAAERGATIHLVHVVEDRGRFPTEPHDVFVPEAAFNEPKFDVARQRLADLIPAGTLVEDKATRLHVLEANDPAKAIGQAAERLDADLICIGTHGRSGLAKVTLGSIAQGLIGQTRRPVLLAHRPLE
jgi:nucleotide-binding universal stress UspA family protein